VIGYSLFFIFNGILVTLASGFGGMVGWWFGRADGRPWLGAGACFGAAFTVNVIMSLSCSSGILVGPIVSLLSSFAASFKIAATTS
jgi:hypothetical protein